MSIELPNIEFTEDELQTAQELMHSISKGKYFQRRAEEEGVTDPKSEYLKELEDSLEILKNKVRARRETK